MQKGGNRGKEDSIFDEKTKGFNKEIDFIQVSINLKESQTSFLWGVMFFYENL